MQTEPLPEQLQLFEMASLQEALSVANMSRMVTALTRDRIGMSTSSGIHPQFSTTYMRNPRFTRDVEELRTYNTDIRQILSDNAIADMRREQAAEDAELISRLGEATNISVGDIFPTTYMVPSVVVTETDITDDVLTVTANVQLPRPIENIEINIEIPGDQDEDADRISE